MKRQYLTLILILTTLDLFAQKSGSLDFDAKWNQSDYREFLVSKTTEICIHDTCHNRLKDTIRVKVAIQDSSGYDYSVVHSTIQHDLDGHFDIYESIIRNSEIEISTDSNGNLEGISNLYDLHCEFIDRFNKVNGDKLSKKKLKNVAKKIKFQLESGTLEKGILENISFIFEPYGIDLQTLDTVEFKDTSMVFLGFNWFGKGEIYLTANDESVNLTKTIIYKPDLSDYLTQIVLINYCSKIGYANITLENITDYEFDVIQNKFWDIDLESGWLNSSYYVNEFKFNGYENIFIQKTTIDYNIEE
jgi:hypothetical protein